MRIGNSCATLAIVIAMAVVEFCTPALADPASILDAVRKRGLKAEIRCDFLASYVQKHPEYADVVAK